MKNLIMHVAPRKTSLSLLVAAIGLLFVSTQSASAQRVYQIQSRKITLEGSGKLKDWKPLLAGVGLQGQFIVNEGELEDLSGFGYGLSLSESPQNTDKFGAAIHQVMNNSGSKEIAFQQQKILVLPIMQMVYISGIVKMADGNHLSSMCLHYQVEEDQSITVKGQQIIWMYEFGVSPKDIAAYHKDDQVSINLEFNLVKEPIVYASNTPKLGNTTRTSSTR